MQDDGAKAIGAFLLAVLLAYIAVVATSHGEPETLQHSVYDTRLDELDRAAIEQAYRDQIVLLYGSWMRDERGQPERAIVGARKARKAFISAMTAIDSRK